MADLGDQLDRNVLCCTRDAESCCYLSGCLVLMCVW